MVDISNSRANRNSAVPAGFEKRRSAWCPIIGMFMASNVSDKFCLMHPLKAGSSSLFEKSMCEKLSKFCTEAAFNADDASPKRDQPHRVAHDAAISSRLAGFSSQNISFTPSAAKVATPGSSRHTMKSQSGPAASQGG